MDEANNKLMCLLGQHMGDKMIDILPAKSKKADLRDSKHRGSDLKCTLSN